MASSSTDKIKQIIQTNDRFATLTGVQLLEVQPGEAKAQLEITPEHLNSAESVHGGALFTLADLAFAAASNSYGSVALGIESSISYFKTVNEGTLTAHCTEINRHPKLATYRTEITTEAGELVASFKGTVYRKSQELTEAGGVTDDQQN